jgi:two-component system phosphate regulon sensor histidine kinase PhoR
MQGSRLEGELAGAERPNRNIHSSMCVPLIRNDEVLGVLNLTEGRGKRAFGDQDLAVLGLFADHAAIAIGNARAFAKEREHVSRLEQLDRMKSDFVAIVSHELKTPLTAIIGSAKTLSKQGPKMNREQQLSFMAMIERQGNRLLRLVDDVLTTARLETGEPTLRREKLDLKAIAAAVIEDLGQTAVGSGRNIQLRLSPDQPRAWGDPTAVMQIIGNLVENALKYSDPGSPVRVTITETERNATIEIADRGQGISPEQLATIFDRFQQAEPSATRSAGGWGLGLYIVKNLVTAHRGEIEVDSREGLGSVFTVRLPMRAEER